MSNRTHWRSLLPLLLLLALAYWAMTRMPAGPEHYCVATGGEWFPDMRRCL